MLNSLYNTKILQFIFTYLSSIVNGLIKQNIGLKSETGLLAEVRFQSRVIFHQINGGRHITMFVIRIPVYPNDM